jgi:hypothetical protein
MHPDRWDGFDFLTVLTRQNSIRRRENPCWHRECIKRSGRRRNGVKLIKMVPHRLTSDWWCFIFTFFFPPFTANILNKSRETVFNVFRSVFVVLFDRKVRKSCRFYYKRILRVEIGLFPRVFLSLHKTNLQASDLSLSLCNFKLLYERVVERCHIAWSSVV